MNQAKSVLAVVELDIIPREVVDRAAWLAEINGAALELLLCDAEIGPLSEMPFVSNEARDIAGRIRAAQEEMLAELAEPARERGLEVATGVLDKRPIADGIVSVALDRDPLLVVKGTRYQSDAERASLLDTDWRLIRTCPSSLWLVKPHALAAHPRIVAAVDPMHAADKAGALDQRIVQQAKSLAENAGGELRLLHAFQPLSGVGYAATRTFRPIKLPVDEISERMEQEHRDRLMALAAQHAIDEGSVHLLPGRPRDILPYLARQEKADVVVMGAIARSARSPDVLGSTAERVLDHLPCDVLVVRP